MVRTKITNYFHPDIWSTIKIQNFAEDQKVIESNKDEQSDEEESKEQANCGVADSIMRSLEYRHILDNLVNQDDSIADASARIQKKWSKTTKAEYQLPLHFPNDNQSEIEIIFKRFYINQTIETISNQSYLSESEVKLIWSKFRSKLRTRNKAIKRWLNKAFLLKQQHKAAILNFLEANKLTQFSLQSIKNDLGQQFPELMNISKPTISKWIRQDYSMWYKKLNKISHRMILHERKRLTVEVIAILGTLDIEESEVVYIDEFTVSEKTDKLYRWS